jgi:hypothetical protein
MKVIDANEKPAPEAGVGKALSQAQDAFSKLMGGSPEEQGQKTLIDYLSRQLNNRFVLLRNIKLAGTDITIPMILLGPSGISVITTRAEKGIYQVKAEAISKVGSSKEFTPIRPSPVNRTLLMTEAVTRYLREHNIEPPEIQPVMFFSNPGTHIDSTRPSVRLVQIDGLERFVSTLLHGQVVLAPEDVHTLVSILNRQQAAAGATPESKHRAGAAGSVIEPRLTQGLDRVGQKFSLSTKQWVLIGVMALFEVAILIAFIFLILSSSRAPVL